MHACFRDGFKDVDALAAKHSKQLSQAAFGCF
jgi:hypothetical protein